MSVWNHGCVSFVVENHSQLCRKASEGFLVTAFLFFAVLTEEAVALLGWTLVHTMVLFGIGASVVAIKERSNMAPEVAKNV